MSLLSPLRYHLTQSLARKGLATGPGGNRGSIGSGRGLALGPEDAGLWQMCVITSS